MFSFRKEKSLYQMSVAEIMNSNRYPHCRAINSPSKSVMKNETTYYHLNPSNQVSFNFGYFSLNDFRDWACGKGRIVKGHNYEEQNKFMRYDELQRMFLFDDFEYYNLFDFNPSLGGDSSKARIVIKNHFDAENLYKEDKFIIAIYNLQIVCKHAQDLRNNLYQNIIHGNYFYDRKEVNNFYLAYSDAVYGSGVALKYLGYGDFIACNTPKTLYNYSWLSYIGESYAYAQTLLDRGFIDDQDIEVIGFCKQNRYNY